MRISDWSSDVCSSDLDLGYAMDEIRSLLSLTDTGAQTCAEVMARTELHLEDVRRRIADLQKIEVTLATTLARCTGDDVAECPILEALQFLPHQRSEEHTSELQSLMRISYAVFCLKKKNDNTQARNKRIMIINNII